jgi:hypothetical protein
MMNYYTWDLHHQAMGAVVEVKLSGNAANVYLVDSLNLGAYKNSRSFMGQGGHYERSPILFRVPSSGQWHVVIDYGGYVGNGRASVRTLVAT